MSNTTKKQFRPFTADDYINWDISTRYKRAKVWDRDPDFSVAIDGEGGVMVLLPNSEDPDDYEQLENGFYSTDRAFEIAIALIQAYENVEYVHTRVLVEAILDV